MRSHWPTAISTEPPCTQLTPSSANEHLENADTRGAEIAQNEPLPIDPLENADTRGAEIAQNEPLPIDPLENADTRGAEIAQNEPLPIDPLENTIGAERKLHYEIVCFRFCPFRTLIRSPIVSRKRRSTRGNSRNEAAGFERVWSLPWRGRWSARSTPGD